MRAPKVMDATAWLPGCEGQAADEISVYTQVKMEDAPSVVFCPPAPCSSVSLAVSPQRRAFVSVSSRFHKVRMSRSLDTSTKAQMAKIMVQYGRPSRSSRKESVRSSFSRTIMGKRIRESSIKNTVGEKFRIGNVYSLTSERTILIFVCGRHKTRWEETKHRPNMKSAYERRCLGRTDIIPWPKMWKPKRYLHGPMTWKVTQRNAWKDIPNLRIKHLSNYSRSQRHAWMTINFEKKKLSQ